MSSSGPPRQVQSSSHRVESSQDRSVGKIRSGSRLGREESSALRQRAACSAPGLHHHIRPPRIQHDFRDVGKHDVRATSLQIAQPPPLIRRTLLEHGEYRVIVALPFLTSVDGHNSGVAGEHRRDRRGDRHAVGRRLGDPRDITGSTDLPTATISINPAHRVFTYRIAHVPICPLQLEPVTSIAFVLAGAV